MGLTCEESSGISDIPSLKLTFLPYSTLEVYGVGNIEE
jgi:hypothetical protein